MRSTSFLGRYAIIIVVCFAFIAPTLFHGARCAVRSNTNKVEDWLPSGYPETADLAWFRAIFGGHMFVVVSWDGCRLGGDPDDPMTDPDDPRIERFAKLLVPNDPNAVAEQEFNVDETANDPTVVPQPLPESMGKYFKSVLTGRRLLNQLTSDPINLPYETAVRRLTGALIGPDGRQTCVLVVLSDEALGDFRRVIGRGGSTNPLSRYRESGILFKALQMSGIDPDNARLGGPPVDNVAIDEEGERTLARLAAFSGLITIILAWCSLRSVTATIIVLACGLLSGAGGLAMVWLSGTTVDAILISMPPLIYVLAVSGAIHIINYYRQEVMDNGLEGAAERALVHGWKPAFLCSVTTSFGLLSLLTSDLIPVRKFGIYSAVGVMLMLIVLFSFLPSALHLWPMSIRTGSKRGAEPAAEEDSVSQFWSRFGGWIIRHHLFVATACLLFIAATGAGVMRARTTIDLMKLFDSKARILSDYKWLEKNVCRLVPMEVILRVPPDLLAKEHNSPNESGRLTLLQRMALVTRVHRAILERFGNAGEGVIGPPMSAMTFIEALPAPTTGISGIVRRTTANSQLNQSYQALQKSNYLHIDPKDGSELWRISLRVGAFENIDYGQFTESLREVIDPILVKQNNSIANDAGEKVSAIYTGVVPIVYKAQRSLLESLISSTFWSFATITPVVMLVSRGIFAGLVAMMPNVLPVLVIFGGMGWLGITIDIGSMMSASIALGVAVDDTIHYLTWFRDELNTTHNRHQAILGAYRRCATPTLQAALINGFGLSVFAFSTFTPTRQFGYLMLTILIAGVIAELILLPALLAGPLGAAFQPSRGKKPRGPSPEPTTTSASRVEAGRGEGLRSDASHRHVPDSHVSSRFARDARP